MTEPRRVPLAFDPDRFREEMERVCQLTMRAYESSPDRETLQHLLHKLDGIFHGVLAVSKAVDRGLLDSELIETARTVTRRYRRLAARLAGGGQKDSGRLG